MTSRNFWLILSILNNSSFFKQSTISDRKAGFIFNASLSLKPLNFKNNKNWNKTNDNQYAQWPPQS